MPDIHPDAQDRHLWSSSLLAFRAAILSFSHQLYHPSADPFLSHQHPIWPSLASSSYLIWTCPKLKYHTMAQIRPISVFKTLYRFPRALKVKAQLFPKALTSQCPFLTTLQPFGTSIPDEPCSLSFNNYRAPTTTTQETLFWVLET